MLSPSKAPPISSSSWVLEIITPQLDKLWKGAANGTETRERGLLGITRMRMLQMAMKRLGAATSCGPNGARQSWLSTWSRKGTQNWCIIKWTLIITWQIRRPFLWTSASFIICKAMTHLMSQFPSLSILKRGTTQSTVASKKCLISLNKQSQTRTSGLLNQVKILIVVSEFKSQTAYKKSNPSSTTLQSQMVTAPQLCKSTLRDLCWSPIVNLMWGLSLCLPQSTASLKGTSTEIVTSEPQVRPLTWATSSHASSTWQTMQYRWTQKTTANSRTQINWVSMTSRGISTLTTHKSQCALWEICSQRWSA